MTATPVNNSIRDLYHQLMLFARHTARFAPIGIPDLNAYFRAAEEAAERGDSASAMFKLIDATSVRRTRRFIQTHYPNAHLDGKPIAFPEARLKTKQYELDDAYPGLFAQVRDDIDALTLARYRPDDYRLDDECRPARADARRHPAHRPAQALRVERARLPADARDDDRGSRALPRRARRRAACSSPGTQRSRGSEADDPAALARRARSRRRSPVAEYQAEELRGAIVERPRASCAGSATPSRTRRSTTIRSSTRSRSCCASELGPEKAIIFTYYADTADWIEQALPPTRIRHALRRPPLRRRHGHAETRAPRERLRRVHEFSPEDHDRGGRRARRFAPEDEKDLLIATDVLAEGQNLQQARYIVNYDMPWNPMRLVQRNGRIDRLGSPFAGQEIYLYNLFPAGELDEILKLYERLLRKIAHANISVGMEAPVFEDAAAIERNFADTARADPRHRRRGRRRSSTRPRRSSTPSRARSSGWSCAPRSPRERLRELLAMPHGAGSGFRSEALPEGHAASSSARGCCSGRAEPVERRRARVALRRSRRARRAASRTSSRSCSGSAATTGEPRELPEEVAPTLYDLWERVQGEVLAEYAERLDPAQAGTRIPRARRGRSTCSPPSDASARRTGCAGGACARGGAGALGPAEPARHAPAFVLSKGVEGGRHDAARRRARACSRWSPMRACGRLSEMNHSRLR